MKIQEIMTQDPEFIAPSETLCVAAEKMRRCDCGVVPVVENGKLIGVITDRDIVIRAIAKHKDVEKEKVKDFMSDGVTSCTQEQTAEEVAKIMEGKQIRRLPVVDRNKKLVGIVSLGDIATHINNLNLSGEILERVSQKTKRKAA